VQILQTDKRHIMLFGILLSPLIDRLFQFVELFRIHNLSGEFPHRCAWDRTRAWPSFGCYVDDPEELFVRRIVLPLAQRWRGRIEPLG